jgi:EmrB/QacA subfamily drug resistance transporter
MSKTETLQAPHVPVSIRTGLSRRRLIAVLVGALLGMMLGALDQTIVGTAMPRIISDLNGMAHYSWVFTAYMLASTVTIPIYGKLSDLYGRRPFFLFGMIVFLVGSALSGLSGSMTQLIAFRALQGLGAGALVPIAVAIIGDIFPPAERGKWQGLMTSVFGLATIIGPLLGGWLTDNWGWRWVFYVNMPVGALAIITSAVAFPKRTHRVEHKVDYTGAALLVGGAVPMLLAFSWAGNQYAWRSTQVVTLLVASAFVLVAFVAYELRKAPEPIINPRLFGNRIFSVSAAAAFMLSAGMMGAVLFLPLFVQAVIGTSATNSGIILMPMMLGFMFSSIVGGQVMSRTGRYKILALVALVIATFGMHMLSTLDETATNTLVIRSMIVVGLGMGVLMSLFAIAVQNAFPLRRIGEVSAGLTFMRSIGGTIGAAVLGSVMTSRFKSGLEAGLSPMVKKFFPAQQLAQITENPQVLMQKEATSKLKAGFAAFGSIGEREFAGFMHALRHALAGAIAHLSLIGMFAIILALLVTLFLKEIPLRKTHHEAEAAPGAAAAEFDAEADWEDTVEAEEDRAVRPGDALTQVAEGPAASPPDAEVAEKPDSV